MRASLQSVQEHASKSVALDSSNEVSASARLSFSQFLRKGAPNRSSSHEHNSRGTVPQLCSPNQAIPFASFNSGPSSPPATSQCASRLSYLGGEPPQRIQLSPLQTVQSKRRSRTFPRDISVSATLAAEPQATLQVVRQLGCADEHPLTLSQLACELDFVAAIQSGKDTTPSHLLPLIKSKTADQILNQLSKSKSSATGSKPVGSCGCDQTELLSKNIQSGSQRPQHHLPSSTACRCSAVVDQPKDAIFQVTREPSNVGERSGVLGKRRKRRAPISKALRTHKIDAHAPQGPVSSSQPLHGIEGSTFNTSTKMTCSLAAPNSNLATKRMRTSGQSQINNASLSTVLRSGEADDPLSDLMAESAIGQPEELALQGPAQLDEALMEAFKHSSKTMILGVSSRKMKSLKFRMRRRDLKLKTSGTPFNKRDSQKNSNRQTAALQRKRDGNGKFLNVPIYPKRQTRGDQQCQIYL